MRDTLTSSNRRDFSQRYSHSYGYYIDNNGVRTPVFIGEVDEDGAYFKTLDGLDFTARCDGGVNFEFAQIAKRIWLGIDGNLYYTHRIATRQWQRGISETNTSAWLLTQEGAISVGVNMAVMRNILMDNPNKSAGQNILLSEQFAICGKSVYLYNMLIGTFDTTNRTVTLGPKFSTFFQEVTDVCKPLFIGVKNA